MTFWLKHIPILLISMLLAAPTLRAAQEATFLLSDHIDVLEDGSVIATGNVEATARGHTLFADEIQYDPETDKIIVPSDHVIYLEDGTVLHSQEGYSTAGMSELFLKDMRTLLEQRLQLSAGSSTRANSGITRMTDVRMTACGVCNPDVPPIWEIRAPSVIHDEERRFIYLRHARFKVFGLPVLYTPWLRVPDPTVDRATGFLPPEVRWTNHVDWGVTLPYFINLSPHHDITLTPYLTPNSRVFTAVYRRAFRRGTLTITGSYANDDIIEDPRASLIIDGSFKIWQDFNLSVHAEAASDDAYMNEYGVDSSTRRETSISVSRIRFHDAVSAQYTYYTPLRGRQDDMYQNNVFLGRAEIIDDTPIFGDTVTLSAFARSFDRGSNADITGRDMRAVTVSGRWHDTSILGNGLSISTQVGATLQTFGLTDDSRFGDQEQLFSPYAAVSLEWPQHITGPLGDWVFNPQMSLITRRGVAANSDLFDPVVVELDDVSYLGAETVAEYSPSVDGLRVSSGFELERLGTKSYARFSLGRVFLNDVDTQMQRQMSSWILGAQYAHTSGFDSIASALADQDGEIQRAEVISSFALGTFTLGLDYYFVQEDPVFEISQSISEWRGSLGWAWNDSFNIKTSVSYDNVQEDFTKGTWGIFYKLDDPYISIVTDFSYNFRDISQNEYNVGLNYRNECVDFLVLAKLDNDEDSDLDPASVFEFKVDFLGYTSSSNSVGSRKCKS